MNSLFDYQSGFGPVTKLRPIYMNFSGFQRILVRNKVMHFYSNIISNYICEQVYNYIQQCFFPNVINIFMK